MALPSSKFRELVDTLVAAFPRDGDLEAMFSYGLRDDFDHSRIYWRGAVEPIARELVREAESRDKLDLLIEAAYAENSDNEQLRAIHGQLPEWIPPPAAIAVRDEARLALGAARARPAPPAVQAEDRSLDWDMVIDFDLVAQDNFFREQLKAPLTGTFAFALSGHRHMMKNYVITRIKRIIANARRDIKPINVVLVARNLPVLPNGHSPIAPAVAAACKCTRMADLFDQPHLDVLLIIWNYDVPAYEMKQMAIAFWNDLTTETASCFQGYQRRLIALWINSGAEPLETFHVVPSIVFDVKEITAHVENYLAQCSVDTERIAHHVANLEGLGGALPDTFDLLHQIVEEVSGGTAR